MNKNNSSDPLNKTNSKISFRQSKSESNTPTSLSRRDISTSCDKNRDRSREKHSKRTSKIQLFISKTFDNAEKNSTSKKSIFLHSNLNSFTHTSIQTRETSTTSSLSTFSIFKFVSISNSKQTTKRKQSLEKQNNVKIDDDEKISMIVNETKKKNSVIQFQRDSSFEAGPFRINQTEKSIKQTPKKYQSAEKKEKNMYKNATIVIFSKKKCRKKLRRFFYHCIFNIESSHPKCLIAKKNKRRKNDVSKHSNSSKKRNSNEKHKRNEKFRTFSISEFQTQKAKKTIKKKQNQN